MKAREFFQRAMMQPAMISGQVQSVMLDQTTGKQTSATVIVGGQAVSIGLDALAPTLGQGDIIRLEQHGSAAAAEYRLVGVTSGAQVLSGFTQAMAAGATIAGVTYGAGDVIVGSLTGGNLLIEYATGNIYHRIGATVYGIEYADGSQVFGEHELVGAVWTPVSYNVLIEADGIALRSILASLLRISSDEVILDIGDTGFASLRFIGGENLGAGNLYAHQIADDDMDVVLSSTVTDLSEGAGGGSAELTLQASYTASGLTAQSANVFLSATDESSIDLVVSGATLNNALLDANGWSVSDAVRMTPEGGLAVKVVAGEALSRGNVVYVKISGGADGKVWKTVYTDGEAIQMPTGIVYANAERERRGVDRDERDRVCAAGERDHGGAGQRGDCLECGERAAGTGGNGAGGGALARVRALAGYGQRERGADPVIDTLQLRGNWPGGYDIVDFIDAVWAGHRAGGADFRCLRAPRDGAPGCAPGEHGGDDEGGDRAGTEL